MLARRRASQLGKITGKYSAEHLLFRACGKLRPGLVSLRLFRYSRHIAAIRMEYAMTHAYVCLGSNMGDAEAFLARARAELDAMPGVSVIDASSLYKTEPQGRKDQPWFLNQVVKLACDDAVEAETLLDAMLAKELEMGRVRDAADRFGPRVIDMDLLLFGQEIRRDAPHLILPHPRMHERAFVLVPLAELAPDLTLPSGERVETLLRKLEYRLEGSAIFQ